MSWRGDRTTPPGWESQRRRVMERDGGVCQVKLPGCTGVATDVDHIVPNWRLGRPATDAELRAACSYCNQELNRREMIEKKSRLNHPSRLETKRIRRKKKTP